MTQVILGIGVALAALAILGIVCLPIRRRTRRRRLEQAQHSFHAEREWLEAKFLRLATMQPAPDTPRWADCFFADDVAYVRSRSTGELSALVAVTLASEADEVGASGRAEVIGNLQVGTAVFRFDGQHWATEGRTLLNLSPSQAIQRFQDDLVKIGEELVQPHR